MKFIPELQKIQHIINLYDQDANKWKIWDQYFDVNWKVVLISINIKL